MALNLRTSCETVLMIYGDLKKKKALGGFLSLVCPIGWLCTHNANTHICSMNLA